MRFTTGAAAYTLTGVEADFALDAGTGAATVTAFVYPGIGGGTALGFPDGTGGSTNIIPTPVATLQAQTVAAVPGSPITYNFVASSAQALQANSTYLVIFTAGNVRARWYNLTDATEAPQAENGSGFVDSRYGIYTNGSPTSVGGIGNSNTFGRIRISGTPFVVTVVPEAGTLALALAGASVFGAVVLRRKR